MTVEPRTTWLFSDSPLNAATVRVVRLFAAAIVHSVSPGCTVCATAAPAGAAAAAANTAASTGTARHAAREDGAPANLAGGTAISPASAGSDLRNRRTVQ